MIQIVITCQCTRCGSTDIVKNGHDYKGAQKFHGKQCGASGTRHATGHYPEGAKEGILRTYRERARLRGVARLFGIARQPSRRWLREAVARLPALIPTLGPLRPDDVLELAELWSLVYKKERKRGIGSAVCRRTRQIGAYFIGERRTQSC